MDTLFQRLPLGAEVAEHLRRQLIFGRIPKGTRLAEEAVSRTLGVSRGPLREALRELEQNGLVHTLPNGRTVAVGLSEQAVKDIYAVRLRLEWLAIDQAVERATDAELEALEQRAQDLTRPLTTQEGTRLDLDLHGEVVRLSKNHALVQAWSLSERLVGSIISESLALPDPDIMMNKHHRDHLEIALALRSRDAEAAQRTLTSHIKLAVRLALQIFQGGQSIHSGSGEPAK